MRTMALAGSVVMLMTLAGGEALAQGGSGQGKQKKCMSGCQMQMRQQMRDCSCMNSGSQRPEKGQGRMRRMGPADGAGVTPETMDGAGAGVPAVSPSAR